MNKDWIEDCATAIWQLYFNWATPERDTIIDVIDWYIPRQEKINLKSTTNKVWKYVTQIIHFSWWNKRTFEDINTETIKQWEFTKMYDKDWRLIMINTKNVDCIEVFKS